MADAPDDPAPGRRPRGRPRNTEPHSNVATWMPASEHDRLIALAHKHGLSVSSTIRRIVAAQLEKKSR